MTAPIRKARDYVYLVFTGVCMGAADVVPGVSGGTMAFIMGIYEELLGAIKSVDLKFFRMLLRFDLKGIFEHVPWKFLVALLSGLAAAVLTLSHAITWALEHHTVLLYAFFFGLIVASILSLGVQLRWSFRAVVSLIVGTVLGWVIVGLVPLDMPHSAPFLFGSGMIAIMAMILPGISGSFILLILGQYAYIINAVKELNLVVIAIVGAGASLGLMGFSRILSWLLARYHDLTLALLIGFMVGSLRKIWPFRQVTATIAKPDGELVPVAENLLLPALSDPQTLQAIGLAFLGFVVITVLDHVHTGKNPILRRVFRRGQV